MLPASHRLTHKRDFDTLFADGRFVGDKLVTIVVWQVDPGKFPRRAYQPDDLKIGFAVGVKVSKSAVQRNRLKRQMREGVRLLLKDARLARGYLVAIIAKPDALGKTYAELEKSVVSALQRARLLKK